MIVSAFLRRNVPCNCISSWTCALITVALITWNTVFTSKSAPFGHILADIFCMTFQIKLLILVHFLWKLFFHTFSNKNEGLYLFQQFFFFSSFSSEIALLRYFALQMFFCVFFWKNVPYNCINSWTCVTHWLTEILFCKFTSEIAHFGHISAEMFCFFLHIFQEICFFTQLSAEMK